MKFRYYVLWPVMVAISLIGGMILGVIGITIGHFQDMISDIRREYVEYTKHYNFKKAQYHETLFTHANRSIYATDDPKPAPMPCTSPR